MISKDIKRTLKAVHVNQTNQHGYIWDNQIITPVFLHRAFKKKQAKSFYFSPWLLEDGEVVLEGSL
jgi:hypothetical protein